MTKCACCSPWCRNEAIAPSRYCSPECAKNEAKRIVSKAFHGDLEAAIRHQGNRIDELNNWEYRILVDKPMYLEVLKDLRALKQEKENADS